MKEWYQSKLLWQNVFVTLMGAALLIADAVTKTPVLTVPGVLTMIAGVFGIIVRVWFTDTPINTPQLQAKLEKDVLTQKITQ